MTETIYHLINRITAPLYGKLYSSSFFFIDYWSFVHLFSGCLIVCCILPMGVRHPLRILGIILFLWEIVEIYFIYIAVHLFKPETIPDQFTDILIGYLGGFVGCSLFQSREKMANGHR